MPDFGVSILVTTDTLGIRARDQSMVESGVTEGGKNTTSFLFRE